MIEARKAIKLEERRQQREFLDNTEEVREACKRFYGFVQKSWHILEPTTPYKPSWHHEAIGEHLEAVHRGEIQRLQINQPPGTMKSLTVSVMFEAWEWGPGATPGLRFLTTSYREDWARRDSRRCRDLILSEWYRTLWPEIVLTRDGEIDFENTYLGNRKAVPFKSMTAGRGNRVVIDDPHSTEQAESDQDRETTSRMFRESVTSRLNDPVKDTIIVMMHRLHPDDVCGVIEQLDLPYTKLVLPMEFVKSLVVKTPFYEDPRTEDGELLCPNRLPRETVEANKLELGEHAYATQYQQQPRAREGSYFFNPSNFLIKRETEGEPVYEPAEKPAICQYTFSVIDTASKVGKARDGTGVLHLAYTQFPIEQVRLIDWELVQIEASLLEQMLPGVLERNEELARETGAIMGSAGAWIEEKDSGIVLIQQAVRRGLNVHPIDSKLVALGKEARAVNVSGYIFRGMVKITKEAYAKTSIFHGRNRNHLWHQATTFRVGYGTPNDEDEMFDCLCYGTALALGDVEMF